MLRPRLAPLAAALPETVPFTGPEALERRSGSAFRARLGANESPFGPSPLAQAAMAAAIADGWKYGDPECHDLRQALAAHHGISADNIVVGEGIDGLLGLAVRLFAGPGTPVVTSLGGYPTLNYHVTGFGARLVSVPYADLHEDIEGLAAAARREDAAVVYLANPDNPMGSWWSASEVERFIHAVPETTLILLDEAYGEFAPSGTMPALDTDRPNVLRLRTFSKAHGMAGLRCGYAIGERQTIRAFERVRNHFGVNAVAQAGAMAALADTEHLASVVTRTASARQRITDIAATNGLHPLPSATNFVAIDTGRDAAFAQRLLEALAQQGIFIRKPAAPGLDHCIRISVGDDAALDLLAEMLPQAIDAAG
ncbi:pyridoxal phosphate-dependent aminotransferase [Devosia sp. SL43]|uniref:pyridoxal phosphate-dependent aminotransferase n=1 Tax=Devosia sp. SL43 TaxID=2806348 RepID=UPI001F00CF21|nr:pyridoxal phosphate-dependent aminotransferase [Devosia sp. SL43]